MSNIDHPATGVCIRPAFCSGRLAIGWLLLLLASFGLATSSSAAVFTVGLGSDCDYEDLQEALWATWFNDALGVSADELHIARNQPYVGEYIVKDQDVTLRGGYETCSDSTPSGRTIIRRPANRRHFTISAAEPSPATGYPRRVHFEDMFLTLEGEYAVRLPYGGALHVSGHVRTELHDTVIEHGSAEYGGGIYLDSTDNAVVTLENGSLIRASYAIYGGGVACHGNPELPDETLGGGIVLLDGGVLMNNRADYGGGAYVADNCYFGTDHLDYTGVFLNTAEEDGGGVYAASGSLVQPTHVMGNVARRGGGIFVTGEGTWLVDHSGRVLDNVASEDGGGVFAEDLAIASVVVASSNCEYFDLDLVEDCALMASNRAGDRGGAVFVQSGATFVSDGRFAKNRAPLGAVAVAVGEGSLVELAVAEIFGNEGDFMVDLAEGGRFEGIDLTIAKNYPLAGDTWYFHALEDPVELRNSIFSDEAGWVHNGPRTWDPMRRCLLVPSPLHHPGGNYIRSGFPDFADEEAHDYQLGSNSDAVDMCPNSLFGRDRLRNPRSVDLPEFPNWYGQIHDAGAFERQADEPPEE